MAVAPAATAAEDERRFDAGVSGCALGKGKTRREREKASSLHGIFTDLRR
jgi:hypothetical protein